MLAANVSSRDVKATNDSLLAAWLKLQTQPVFNHGTIICSSVFISSNNPY